MTSGGIIDLEAELDRLYAAPLDQFIKLRNELAGELRKERGQEAASLVGALKKPSISAWAVNQLARTAQVDIQRLIRAGEALEKAQRDALSGRGSGGFESARKDESDAIRRLRGGVRQVLPSASQAVVDRVVNTLRAGTATPEGRDLIKQGRLAEDLEPPGFEALSSPSPTSPATKRVSTATRKQSKVEALRRRKDEAAATSKTKAAEAAELERQAKEAVELATKVSKAAATARKRADEAAAQFERLAAELAGFQQPRNWQRGQGITGPT